MKRSLLFSTLFVFMGLSAQNLSLNELIALRKMSMEEGEIFLTTKGWKYKEGENNELFTTVQYVLNNKQNGSAEAFLALLYATTEHRLWMQFANAGKYNEFIASVKELKLRLVNNGIDQTGALMKEYQGATTTVSLKTSKLRQGTATSYYIEMKDNR